MISEIAYLIFSILSLSFLIFIHELGHYWVAKREGFEIEVFSIGFGKPFLKWQWGGVQWQICYLIFGGYVKIKGMYPQEDEPLPVTFKGSFYEKHPWQRIKVALAGPLANFLLALVIFSFIWQFGGLEKSFYEFSPYLGRVEKGSPLHREGFRPGDKVLSYDYYKVRKSEDHLYGAMLASEKGVWVQGEKWNPQLFVYEPFEKSLSPYEDPQLVGTSGEGIKTLGIKSPAMFLLYDRFAHSEAEPMIKGSPLKEAGLRYKDRLLWFDGAYLFSSSQLGELLNDQHALVSVLREGRVIHERIPKYSLWDLQFSEEQKEDFEDIKFEMGLKEKLSYFIPYELDNHGLVLGPVALTQESKTVPYSILQKGDRVLAIDGHPIQDTSDIFSFLQQKTLLTVVQSNYSAENRLPYLETDKGIQREKYTPKVENLLADLGRKSLDQITYEGEFRFLKPFAPKKRKDFASIQEQLLKDPAGQEILQSEAYQKNILGVYFQDQKVNYNPDPLEASQGVVTQIFRTLSSLFSGDLSPKWLGGAVGMVQYMHVTLSYWGLDDALYWMAVISLNLGILNLLPIPVLDGGYVVLSLIEWVWGRAIPTRVLEYILMPFMALILFLFVYTTFNDLLRLFF